jgi:hypothetical protein
MSDFIINIAPEHAIFKSLRGANTIRNFEATIEYFDTEPSTRIKENDAVITINNPDDYLFEHSGFVIDKPTIHSVRKAEAKELIPNFHPEFEYFRHTIPVKIHKKFLENNLLDEYMYSLIAVRNFSNPSIHFRHKVTSLNHNDYETIDRQMIYVTRTVFARLINALPRENRLDFVMKSIAEFDTVDLRTVPFLKAIDFLKIYVEENFLSQGRLLLGIDSLLNKGFTNLKLPIEQFSFASPDESKFIEDNILKQASLFRELFSIDENFNLINKVLKGLPNNKETEERFNALFRNKAWPIILRI